MKKIPIKFTKIDDEDFDRVSKFNWSMDGRGYVKRVTDCGSVNVFLHRFIMNCPDDMQVDHINNDPLDNRKSNLRICTNNENQFNKKKNLKKINTSKYKGVTLCAQTKRWRAQGNVNNKRVNIGRFNTEKEAALAYNEFAKKHHGEFASLNEVSDD